MIFNSEHEFESAVINHIRNYGWDKYDVINYPTEASLVENWKDILFQNNKGVDCLNGQPLTTWEMEQVMEQVNSCHAPLDVNGFINGKGILITRDNPADELHLGRQVTLQIYDRRKIMGGDYVYQIARQPRFNAPDEIMPERRGDFMLLINGMPVIHAELKKSDDDVMKACNQIETYSREGIFARGIFSLVQVFVAMTPAETVYFANPGQNGAFDPHFFFHWADVNNKPINEWDAVVRDLLNIPMAHLLIGYYTVADKRDGVLKVMRSYQYYAASFIQSRVADRKDEWKHADRYGGYIWNTTGSGKTMTSFKAALLIAEFGYADKVVFLVDRCELNEQSFGDYKSYADDATDIQDTARTTSLITKLKSGKTKDRLIITSLHKMSNVRHGNVSNELDIDIIARKRIVFIVDECHRSTFGEMLLNIKHTFPTAMFFGFTGIPIKEENQRKGMTTANLFGNELHVYSLGCGIRDGNVLGFDRYKVCTYDDSELRKEVALYKAKAKTEKEALADPAKAKVYMHFMQEMDMGYHIDAEGNYVPGIEDFVPPSQYEREKHYHAVVEKIRKHWNTVSYVNRFHAILATSSIAEAIIYYRLMKDMCPDIRCTAIFDEQTDYAGALPASEKNDALKEILLDYKKMFNKKYDLKHYDDFCSDVCLRLAHKEHYKDVEPAMQLHLVIVVDKLLTGFDSKWINALYLDKKMEFQNLIQAFSRTNRLNGEEKKFGIIKYFRYPHTMERNIERAVDLYSQDEPLQLFVNKLPQNVEQMNHVFAQIASLFQRSGIINFERLPNEMADRAMFAKKFKVLQGYIDSARLQGFVWEQREYDEDNIHGVKQHVEVNITQEDYIKLLQRYKELAAGRGSNGGGHRNVPFAIDTYITEIRMDAIDRNYINQRFGDYLHAFSTEGQDAQTTQQLREDLHQSFATLSQAEQRFAYVILSDIQRGRLKADGKTFRQLLTEYQGKAEADQIHIIAEALGVDEEILRQLVLHRVTPQTIDDKGQFTELKEKADKVKAKEYFERAEHQPVMTWAVNMKMDGLLRRFLFAGDSEREDIVKEVACAYKVGNTQYEVYEPEMLMAAEDIYIYGSIPVDLPKTNRSDLVANKLDLVLMYAIGNPAARAKTEATGKIAIGIKDSFLNEEQISAYQSVKHLMFHYWSNPKDYILLKKPVLVNPEDVPSDYLVRLPNDAVKFLLLEYNPQEEVSIENINVLKTQRRGEIRYLPFITTIESITEE